jgi:hypothetical protein
VRVIVNGRPTAINIDPRGMQWREIPHATGVSVE